EGGEEVGSQGLDKYLEQHVSELACDAVLVSDTGMAGINRPSLCVALRGLCYVELFVNGPTSDLHSGSYGGVVENPAIALARLISQLKDDSGKVLIPGFYDDVRTLGAADRAALQTAAKSDSDLLRSTGAPRLFGEPGFTPTERLGARPTLDVNGIYGGFTGEGAKTVIPAQAAAKISMRLVADQEPKKIGDLFERYVNQIAPDTVKVRVERLHGGHPYLARTDGPAIGAAKQALQEAFDSEPLLEREGGSIPIVVTLAQALKVDVVLMGFGYPDEHSHAPNEHLPLSHFDRGMVAAARFFEIAGSSLAAR
ncbi:MAG: M20/M25/M40 family metallo-hydrolase, partial [Deltaproteobacteria bacterium]|nr:M20/M25/M40 family metallo-hydrolase [Deltaproteobacteria bacterium]